MMKEQDFIAHVRVEEDAFRIQTVKEHSVGTATLSESFASVFGAAAWGKQNGWWHVQSAKPPVHLFKTKRFYFEVLFRNEASLLEQNQTAFKWTSNPI